MIHFWGLICIPCQLPLNPREPCWSWTGTLPWQVGLWWILTWQCLQLLRDCHRLLLLPEVIGRMLHEVRVFCPHLPYRKNVVQCIAAQKGGGAGKGKLLTQAYLSKRNRIRKPTSDPRKEMGLFSFWHLLKVEFFSLITYTKLESFIPTAAFWLGVNSPKNNWEKEWTSDRCAPVIWLRQPL